MTSTQSRRPAIHELRDRRLALNAWTRMPGLGEQARLPGVLTADFAVVRALLRKGRAYDQAVQTFEPYDRIQEPGESAREGMRLIALHAVHERKDAFDKILNLGIASNRRWSTRTEGKE